MLFFKPQQWPVLLAVLIFCTAWYTFIATAPPTITFEDSGELTSEPYILGSAHPSGQPIFTVFGKIITGVPLGPISWRTNLYSSLASAIALVFLFLVYLKLGKEIDNQKEIEFYYIRLITGVCACLFTVFSFDYWLQSILTEVYALNALFFILAVYLALCFSETNNDSYLYLLGFTLGLSMGNHHTTILLIPALAYLVLYKRWRVLLDLKVLVVIISLAVIGLSIYLELPLRAVQKALINWGDPQTRKNFLDTFFRHQYRPIMIARTSKIFLDQLSFFAFSIQQSFLIVWLSLIGIFFLAFKLSRKAIFVLTLFIFYTIGFIYLINPEVPDGLPFLLRTFYLPPYMLLGIMSGMGLLAVMEFIYYLDQKNKWQLKELFLYFSLLLLVLPTFTAKANSSKVNRRYYYYTFDYVNNMLKSVKPNGILFTLYAQDTFPLWYSQFVEGKRLDVAVIHQKLFINDWAQGMAANFHPELNLELKSRYLNSVPLYIKAEMLQDELMVFNRERPVFGSQYCMSFNQHYRLKKKGAVFELILPDRQYSNKEIDPRRYYNFRGFNRQSKFFQMEGRALEIMRTSYLF